MEKVEDMLKDLRLSEAERKGVKLGWSDGKKAGVVAVQALGKLLSEKPAHVEGLEDSLGRVWCPLKGTDCKVMRDNLFMFTFKQESGKRKALLEGPWKVGNDLLVMEDFDPEKSLDEYEFGTTPIWVRVLKLPLGMMNRKTGERLGNQIGEYMDVDVGEDDMAAGEYLRIKVRINLANPIMRGVTVQLGDNRRERLCPLEFEFLPKFCFTCGIIGHEDKACKIQLATGEKQQYGKWLIAYIPKRRNDNEKSKWGKISDAGGQWRSSSSGGRQLQLRSNTLSWRKDIDNRNQQVGSGTAYIPPKGTNIQLEVAPSTGTNQQLKEGVEGGTGNGGAAIRGPLGKIGSGALVTAPSHTILHEPNLHENAGLINHEDVDQGTTIAEQKGSKEQGSTESGKQPAKYKKLKNGRNNSGKETERMTTRLNIEKKRPLEEGFLEEKENKKKQKADVVMEERDGKTSHEMDLMNAGLQGQLREAQ
jgi:hypothetical protein